MSRCLLIALMLLPWLAGPCRAGAWPREKGQVFVVLSGQIEARDATGLYRQHGGLYAEYGATDRLTLGLDLGNDMIRMTKTIGFLRWPLGPPDRPLKVAVELGAGEVEQENALRPGLSLGRGIVLWDRPGWLAFDARAALLGGRDVALESDLTFGLSTGPKVRLILQLQTGRPETGDAYSRLAPAIVYETGPGRQIELGVIAPITGGGEKGIKLGLWRSF